MKEIVMRKMLYFSFLFMYAVTLNEGAGLCPNDWVSFQNSCYAFIDDVVPWTSAEAYCRILHSQMLEVETPAENDFIASQIRSRTGMKGAWQGMNDLLREGRWVFNSNGQVPTYFNWLPGQPDNSMQHENGEDCVWITEDGRWGDLWCEDFYSTPYRPAVVCETHYTFWGSPRHVDPIGQQRVYQKKKSSGE